VFTFPLNSDTNDSLFLRPASLFTNLNGDVLLTCHPLGIPSFTDAANSQRRLRSSTKPIRVGLSRPRHYLDCGADWYI